MHYGFASKWTDFDIIKFGIKLKSRSHFTAICMVLGETCTVTMAHGRAYFHMANRELVEQ